VVAEVLAEAPCPVAVLLDHHAGLADDPAPVAVWWSRRATDQAALDVALRLAGGRGVDIRIVRHASSQPPDEIAGVPSEAVVVDSHEDDVLQQAFAGASLIVIGRDQAESRRDLVLATAGVPALIVQPTGAAPPRPGPLNVDLTGGWSRTACVAWWRDRDRQPTSRRRGLSAQPPASRISTPPTSTRKLRTQCEGVGRPDVAEVAGQHGYVLVDVYARAHLSDQGGHSKAVPEVMCPGTDRRRADSQRWRTERWSPSHSSTNCALQCHGYSPASATNRRISASRALIVAKARFRASCWLRQPSSISTKVRSARSPSGADLSATTLLPAPWST
jgi:hypothetical protein